MQLFHTSSVEIKKITKNGTFGDCLFFSGTGFYFMNQNASFKYVVDASEMSFVEVSSLDDDEIIERLMSRYDIDYDDSFDILTSRKSILDIDGTDYEDDFYIQELRGECAKKMGYDGCKDKDEQGTVYIIPMFGREDILVLVGVE